MCCIEESRWEAVPDSQRKKIMADYGQLIEELVKGGQYLGGAKLDPSRQAITVRRRNGKPVLTDGPFAETKEQLGGYHVVDCTDREAAISLATRFPTLEVGGTIEVRAIAPAFKYDS
jgi:hypothetical protein